MNIFFNLLTYWYSKDSTYTYLDIRKLIRFEKRKIVKHLVLINL